MLNKLVFWMLGIVGVVVLALATYLYLDFNGHFKDSSSGEQQEQQDKEAVKVDKQANPFGDDLAPGEVSDSDIQSYIHKMSHQKVEADEKWGFHKITDKRITWLQKAVDRASLEHGGTYSDIISKWSSSDFSEVDRDHNTVWELQDGSVGEATGILSEEEEKAYIEAHTGQ